MLQILFAGALKFFPAELLFLCLLAQKLDFPKNALLLKVEFFGNAVNIYISLYLVRNDRNGLDYVIETLCQIVRVVSYLPDDEICLECDEIHRICGDIIHNLFFRMGPGE